MNIDLVIMFQNFDELFSIKFKIDLTNFFLSVLLITNFYNDFIFKVFINKDYLKLIFWNRKT